MDIGIVAGEISGNMLGAGLLQALRQHTSLNVRGIGGPEMVEAGCHSLHDIERLAVMGWIEPLCRLPELFKIRRDLYHTFTQQKPDVFIGIDAPDFNLGLEHKLRKQGIPIVHYVSPSVWAWRKKRIHTIAKSVDLMLTLFPFEAAFYEKHNVPACFVGHPLADKIPLQPDTLAARTALGLDPTATYIALLPGSRRNEIREMAELFIETGKRCWQQQSTLRFLTSAANPARNKEFQEHCHRVAPELPIQFFEGRSHEVMAAADVVLVTSGTATLETMLYKRPMVIAYRMSKMNYAIARHLIKIPYIGLPNILANEMVVPEFIQDAAEPDALAAAIFDYLDHPAKIQQLQTLFADIHEELRCNANERAAEAVLNLLR